MEFDKQFDKCPVCGSIERFFEGIIKELHERGLLDKKITCFDFQLKKGVAVPETKLIALPFGSKVPSFLKITDTCCGCGTEYAVRLSKGIVQKSLEIPRPQMPQNRAERRRNKPLVNFPTNNPLTS